MQVTTPNHPRDTGARSIDRDGVEARGFDEQSGTGRRFDEGLRVAVGAVDRQMSLLAARRTTEGSSPTVGDLLSTWATLLDRLDLGPAPDVRSCPVCGHQGMSAATRCGYCWTRLTPVVRDAHLASG